jgi:hypothetical protein
MGARLTGVECVMKFDDPKSWYDRAAQLRALADNMATMNISACCLNWPTASTSSVTTPQGDKCDITLIGGQLPGSIGMLVAIRRAHR